jgi:hypothetical protein
MCDMSGNWFGSILVWTLHRIYKKEAKYGVVTPYFALMCDRSGNWNWFIIFYFSCNSIFHIDLWQEWQLKLIHQFLFLFLFFWMTIYLISWCVCSFLEERIHLLGCAFGILSRRENKFVMYFCMLVDRYPLLLIAYSYWMETWGLCALHYG